MRRWPITAASDHGVPWTEEEHLTPGETHDRAVRLICEIDLDPADLDR